MKAILQEVAHRPWPRPAGPWVMAQSWHDLLFAHWPVDSERVRPLVPDRLEIDSFDGQAWLAVVPFRMTGVRLCGTPAVPWLSAFPELNVRTYVKYGGKPGVWFFSLDAGNPLAVVIARAWFSPALFSRADVLRGARWLHPLPECQDTPESAVRIVGMPVSSFEQNIFGATGDTRTFPHRTLLSVCVQRQ